MGCCNDNSCASSASVSHAGQGQAYGELRVCPPLPWNEQTARAATDLIMGHLAQGHNDPERLAMTVLVTMFPVTWTNAPIPWADLPDRAAPCLKELRRLVRAIARKHVADFELHAASDRYMAAVRQQGARG